MERCPRLKVIASNTTGVAHIDMEAAARKGIKVCALHDEPAFLDRVTPTAEHAIGLLIAAWRKIPAAHGAASGGVWNRWDWGAPRMLSRMRLGIVGYGRLGRKVAAIARAMDMDVAFYDPNVSGSMNSILQLASRSDALSIHAKVTPESTGLVSRKVLEAMPKGSVLVNSARAEIVDEVALLDMLENGHLYSAAVDVADGEFDPGFNQRFMDSRLATYARNNDNLVLTPHIGGSTLDAWSETQRFAIEKAAQALGLDAHPERFA